VAIRQSSGEVRTIKIANKEGRAPHVEGTLESRIHALGLLFVDRVQRIPEVLAVAYGLEEDGYCIRTILRSDDRGARQRIYAEELRLLTEYPGIPVQFVTTVDKE